MTIEKNMLRPRAKKLPDVTDEMFAKILPEHQVLFKEFLDVNSQLREQTLNQYSSGLRQWFWWVHKNLDDKPMWKITKRDFLKYMSFLDSRNMSSSAKGFKKSAVSTLCNYIENVIADDDPNYKTFRNFTKGLPAIPKTQVYDKIKVTKEEYDFMLDELLKRENYLGAAWLATAFNVGARRAELIQFKTEILDYPIPEGQNYVLSHVVYGKGRGDGKKLNYMVNKEALKYMKLWIDKRGYEHEYIFTTNYGGKIKQMSLTWADEFCANVLSPMLGRRINVHIFKSSCITALLEQGVDISLVSKFVAHHESIETTSIYDLRDFEEEKNKIFDNF